MSPLSVLSLFSGIGAFEKALSNNGIPFELINYCEVDKYAAKAYSLLHNIPESKNLGDITKVDEKTLPQNIDLLTYGFPCQDISTAGIQKGLFNADGSVTRSGLFFEALRIIKHCKPKIAIAENVKALTCSRFTTQFALVLQCLQDAGYRNYWKLLDAKDFGLPQVRERILIVSIREDVDASSFHFPDPIPLTSCLDDFCETDVPEEFFLTKEQIEKYENSTYYLTRHRLQDRYGICHTLCASGSIKCVCEKVK